MAGVPLVALMPEPDDSPDDAHEVGAMLVHSGRQYPDDAHEVGAMPVRSGWTAMLVGRDDAGRLVYVEETPVEIAFQWRGVEYGGGRHHEWWRLEGKVARVYSPISAGAHFVVAEHPYGNGWHDHARFKPECRKGPGERPDPMQKEFNSTAELMEWVESLPYDFWESQAYLTAAISKPRPPAALGKAVRHYQKEALLVFGACPNFHACEQELLGGEVVEQLLKDTRANRIAFWKEGAKLSTRPKLYDEVIDMAVSLMVLSIRQALAGPHRDSENWVGRPLTDRIGQVYREHLNRCNRSRARDLKRFSAYRDRIIRRVKDGRKRKGPEAGPGEGLS